MSLCWDSLGQRYSGDSPGTNPTLLRGSHRNCLSLPALGSWSVPQAPLSSHRCWQAAERAQEPRQGWALALCPLAQHRSPSRAHPLPFGLKLFPQCQLREGHCWVHPALSRLPSAFGSRITPQRCFPWFLCRLAGKPRLNVKAPEGFLDRPSPTLGSCSPQGLS